MGSVGAAHKPCVELVRRYVHAVPVHLRTEVHVERDDSYAQLLGQGRREIRSAVRYDSDGHVAAPYSTDTM